jgi:hypothetical protein
MIGKMPNPILPESGSDQKVKSVELRIIDWLVSRSA